MSSKEEQPVEAKELTEEEKQRLEKKREKARLKRQKAKAKKSQLKELNKELDESNLKQKEEAPKELDILKLVGKNENGETISESTKDFKFWKTQPVPALNSNIPESVNYPIEPDKKKEEIRAQPYPLPDGLKFVTVNIKDPKELDEVYDLLYENYVEDDSCSFRFKYSTEFLKWALTPPGYEPDWFVGIRMKDGGKLVCLITGIPVTLRIHNTAVKMAEINFLCIHKKIRDKRMAPLLISEVKRRIHLKGLFQAVYTAGRTLPTPITTCTYFHRSLNPVKLVEIGFSYATETRTPARLQKIYKLPEHPTLPGVVPFERRHIREVALLLKSYNEKFGVAPLFSAEEIEHYFLPRNGVDENKKAVDFFSFYFLPSSILDNEKYDTLSAVYSYYYAAGKHTAKELMEQALILAKSANADVFNCLDLMENRTFLEPLMFAEGDGKLNYYIFNWACHGIAQNDLAVVLV